MEDGHCAMAGCDYEFCTDNYGIRTTPSKEFRISSGTMACPFEDRLDRNKTLVRTIKSIQELKHENLATKASLTEDETLAVVRKS